MSIQTTLNLTNAVRAQYLSKYVEAAELERVYDRYAVPVGKEGVEQAYWLGTQVQANFLSDLAPATAAISQTTDLTPATLRDATATITPTSRANAIQWAELLELSAYTNYGESRFMAIGKNQMESVDLLAQAAALQGGVVHSGAVRASLDAGTAGHRFTDTAASIIDAKLQSMKCPAYVDGGRKMFFATMHPYAFHDLRLGGNVVNVGTYQDKRIIMNFEMGEIGPFKLIVTPWAKVFWGAGSDNAAAIATTLAAAENALDTSISVASAASMVVGMRLNIGTEETANTHYETNESVLITDINGTDISIAGEGANGGLRFDHALGAAVRNADSVFPIVFGGPSSLAKIYDRSIGEYGQVVGPKRDGIVDQFATLGWKWYGNYGRWVESWVIRGEFASSLEA
jgi:N4-gp56 family major capsid protein